MEHIQNIKIKNFKSIRDVTINGCKRINVFVGPPNVGKSNILEALGLFGYKLNNDNLSFLLRLDNIVRFENFIHLFHFGDIINESFVSVNGLMKCSIEYENANSLSLMFQKSDKNSDSWIKEGKFNFNANGVNMEIEPFISGKDIVNNIVTHIEFSKTLPSIKRYIFSRQKFNATISARNLVVPFGDNLFEVLRYNVEIRKQIGELFAEYGLKLSFSEDTKLNIYKQLDEFTIFNVPFTQIADTLQRLVFYKTAIAINSNSILLFEEPESHLYEPYILDVSNAIKYDEKDNQYFIVTHNQYFIEELLRDEESKDDTNIYLVGLQNGETAVRWLDPSKSEDVFHNGLNVFFNYDNLWRENA